MTMHEYPEHLDNCVEDASHLFPGKVSDLHKHYQIVCHCGGSLFELFVSDKESVLAQCATCGTRIVVYDLASYPAAVKLRGEELFRPLAATENRPSRVYVRYEYGPLDADQVFDRNDITWCQVFVESVSGRLEKVFDDETA